MRFISKQKLQDRLSDDQTEVRVYGRFNACQADHGDAVEVPSGSLDDMVIEQDGSVSLDQAKIDARESANAAKKSAKKKARKKVSNKRLSANADLAELKDALQDVIDSLQD